MSKQLKIPKYKLTYFDGRGRAELCRMMFAYTGIPYEDVRITKEQWEKMKEDTPCFSLPVLEIDGKKYGQSMAISRFIAREYGLYGNSNLHMAEVDMILDFLSDAVPPFIGAIFENDEQQKKAKFMAALDSPAYKNFMKRIDARLKDNKSSGFLVGHALTMADLAVMNFMYNIIGRDPPPPPEMMALVPETVQALYKKVSTIPTIANWMKKRNPTAF